MKKIYLTVLLLASLLLADNAISQVVQTGLNQTKNNVFQISLHGGWDKPSYRHYTPFIKYKGGVNAGLSAEYYWRKWGIGFDADYIQNSPQNTLPVSGLVNPANTAINNFLLIERKITRYFIGIGPGYKFKPQGKKWQLQATLRAGLGAISGGLTELREKTTTPGDLLNFHAGYQTKSVFSGKAQLQGNYFITHNIGLQAGFYYINHFRASELADPSYGFAAKYQPMKPAGSNTLYDGGYYVRMQPCNCGVSSIGMFAGITIKAGKRRKISPDEYSLIVTAKDKASGVLLPGTTVLIKSRDGATTQSGITNNYGVVVFKNINPSDYDIAGTLADDALQGSNAFGSEFIKNKTVHKTIFYTSTGFVIKGRVTTCNEAGNIEGIKVILKNSSDEIIRSATTDTGGNYLIALPQVGDYLIYGQKGSYYSQVEEVTPANYSRGKTFFIHLEICAEKTDCGKAIKLKNILFDLDKYAIKPLAAKELDRLVQFMKDNPSIRVELGSHTDCRNTHEYNQRLSENRAKASVDYVVSKGIARDRLEAKGYGETRLLNRCADGISCTEAEHAINRRTEMKVICPNNN